MFRRDSEDISQSLTQSAALLTSVAQEYGDVNDQLGVSWVSELKICITQGLSITIYECNVYSGLDV